MKLYVFVGVSSHPVPSIEFKIEYSMLKKTREEWYSSPFYSHPGGYKLCLKVDASGRSSGAGTHLSVLM